MDEIVFHFGNRSRPRTKPFSILEITLALGRNHFPFWKTVSSKEDFTFHFGKRFPRVGIPLSILENDSPELGFHFPFWKMKSQGLKSQKHVFRRVFRQEETFMLRSFKVFIPKSWSMLICFGQTSLL